MCALPACLPVTRVHAYMHACTSWPPPDELDVGVLLKADGADVFVSVLGALPLFVGSIGERVGVLTGRQGGGLLVERRQRGHLRGARASERGWGMRVKGGR